MNAAAEKRVLAKVTLYGKRDTSRLQIGKVV
jgi:hypothetical protein